jgi:hypothetical protein
MLPANPTPVFHLKKIRASALGNQRQGADRVAVPDLHRCDNQDGALGWQLVEIGEAGKTEAIVAVKYCVGSRKFIHSRLKPCIFPELEHFALSSPWR